MNKYVSLIMDIEKSKLYDISDRNVMQYYIDKSGILTVYLVRKYNVKLHLVRAMNFRDCSMMQLQRYYISEC